MDDDFGVVMRDQAIRIHPDDSLLDCRHCDNSLHLVGLPSMVRTSGGINFRVDGCDERLPRQLQPSRFDRCSRLSFHAVGRLFSRTSIFRFRYKRRSSERKEQAKIEAHTGKYSLAKYRPRECLHRVGVVDEVQRMASPGDRSRGRDAWANSDTSYRATNFSDGRMLGLDHFVRRYRLVTSLVGASKTWRVCGGCIKPSAIRP